MFESRAGTDRQGAARGAPPHRAAQALAAWLVSDDARWERLSDGANISIGFIDRLLDGEIFPEAEIQAAIGRETEGAVTPDLWARPPAFGGWAADFKPEGEQHGA